MKQFLTTGLYATFIITALLFAGCSGEDGDPGPAGENGKDGAGLEYSTQYGSIVATFKGTRSDGVPFTYTAEYKYVQPGNEGATWSYWKDVTDENGVTSRNISLVRYTNLIGTEGADIT